MTSKKVARMSVETLAVVLLAFVLGQIAIAAYLVSKCPPERVPELARALQWLGFGKPP
jgi:hypothetical protein